MNYTRLENYLQFAHDALDKMESALDSGYQLREEDHIKALNEAIRSIKNVAEELGVRLGNLAFVPDVTPLDKVQDGGGVMKWIAEEGGVDYISIQADKSHRNVGFGINAGEVSHTWTPEFALSVGYTLIKAAYEAKTQKNADIMARRGHDGGDL